MHAATASFRLDAAADSFYFQAAAAGLCFDQFQRARNLNNEVRREAARALAFGGLPADPRPVTLRSSAYTNHLESAPRFLLRAGTHPLAHCIAHITLVATLHMHRP